jgi:paraquat-inducible protein B
MTPTDYPTANINPKPRFSLVWIIPLIAALIGGWLIYKYYSERGTIITITFDQAAGIEAKKTLIRYKDIQVGKVKELNLTEDLKKVNVTVEISPEMAKNLGSKTRFWVERPRITLQGISGLDTLLSGVHIGMDPGKPSEAKENYTGLASPPIINADKQGTTVTLNSSSLGSLDVGSPVYYRKINVGEVTGYSLNDHNGSVDISIYVHAPYDKKIKTNSRFWNASGVELSLGTSGVVVQMESVISLLIGGIAFETATEKPGFVINGDTSFKLYESYKLAKDDTQRLNKLFYTLYFTDSLHGLSPGSLIEYNGVKVGKVENILLEDSGTLPPIRTLVKASLFIDKFSDNNNRINAEKTLQDMVKSGLKAQLDTASLLTGSQYISLVMLQKPLLNDSQKAMVTLLPTTSITPSIFPTTAAKTSLLNFDASEISGELTNAITSITALINSPDIKKTLKGLADSTESISKISKQLDKEGFSGELVDTLTDAKKTLNEISRLVLSSDKTINVLQKDVSQSLKTVNNVGNKVQQDLRTTLKNIDKATLTLNKSMKSTLSENSPLQYRLQKLIEDLSEASKSFSVLADTIQRKPNSVIFGK